MANNQDQITSLPTFVLYMKRHRSWPKTGEESKPSKSFYMFQYIQIVGGFLFCVAGLIKMGIDAIAYQIPLEQAVPELSKIVSIIGLLIIRLGFLVEMPELVEILLEFSRFERNLKWSIGRKILTRYELYLKVLFNVVMYSCFITFGATVLFAKCSPNGDNFQRICGLYFNIYLPFNYNYTLTKLVITSLQFIFTFNTIAISISCAISGMLYSQHVNVRLQLFKNRLNTFLESNQVRGFDRTKWHQNLVELEQEHCGIIRLGNRVRKAFSNMLFVHFAVTSTILGLSAFVFVKTHSFLPVFRAIDWIMFLWIICYASQQLTDESTDVANVIYNSKWYEMDVRIQKDLILMIAIAQQRPLYLESCSFSRFNLEFLLNMLKTSYTFSTVLNNQVNK